MRARYVFSALAGVLFAATIFAVTTTIRHVSRIKELVGAVELRLRYCGACIQSE